MDINIDRFSGEAAQAPIWGRCGYCGADVFAGYPYYVHEGIVVCTECSERYAYAVFERDACLKTAESEDKCDD